MDGGIIGNPERKGNSGTKYWSRTRAPKRSGAQAYAGTGARTQKNLPIKHASVIHSQRPVPQISSRTSPKHRPPAGRPWRRENISLS